MPSVCSPFGLEECVHLLTWQLPWAVGTVRLKQPFRLARWPPDYGTWGLYCQSPPRGILEDTIQAHHPRSHITMRSSAEKSSALSSRWTCSLTTYVNSSNYPTWFLTATTIPGGLGHFNPWSYPYSDACCDGSRSSLWSRYFDKVNQMDRLLPQCRWYEETHGMKWWTWKPILRG